MATSASIALQLLLPDTFSPQRVLEASSEALVPCFGVLFQQTLLTLEVGMGYMHRAAVQKQRVVASPPPPPKNCTVCWALLSGQIAIGLCLGSMLRSHLGN